MNMIRLAIADDHVMLRNGLAQLLESKGYEIALQVNNGQQLIEEIKNKLPVQIIIMDISMPVLDGYKTTEWLSQNFPEINVIALSMLDNESAILKMLRLGAKAFLLKDASPNQLCQAIENVLTRGFHFNDTVNNRLLNKLYSHENNITEREKEFLLHCTSELTYKEIADNMGVSPRTVDGYRDKLFHKLEIKSRVGLAIFAIKEGFVIL
jgi:two-component system, NarL family, invasion response regulator UvrY